MADLVCPDNHFLESWFDAENARGVFSFGQPLVSPIGDSRAVIESLATWSGAPSSLVNNCRGVGGNDSQWDQRIHDGYETTEIGPVRSGSFRSNDVKAVRTAASLESGSMALVLYSKLGMPSSMHAYNPWLHELPDPISKAVWDNYACLSPAAAERLGVEQGDVVRVSGSGTQAVDLPVLLQAGQHDDVVAVAMGYGSELSRRFANLGPQWLERRPTVGENGVVGVDAIPLLQLRSGRRLFFG